MAKRFSLLFVIEWRYKCLVVKLINALLALGVPHSVCYWVADLSRLRPGARHFAKAVHSPKP